ncbi:MFS transporter [Devosia sp.]|uniref:MFS transporter n=2 Tax=Devosia sp. TaxID=1871048 RepID=UPI002FC8D48C
MMGETRRMPVTAMLGANMFFSGVTFASTAPYASIVGVETLGMSTGQFAALFSFGAVVGTFISLGLGYLSDKLPDRRILVLAAALAGMIGQGLIYLVPTQLSFMIAMGLIMPLGFSMFSQSFAYVRVYFIKHDPARADFMVSALRTVFTVAWTIVPPIAGYVAAEFSVFNVYLMSALSYAACGLIFITMMTDPGTRVANVPPAPKPAREAGAARAKLPMPIISGVVGLTIITVATRLVGMGVPLLIVTQLGGTLTDVGIYAGIAAGLELPFMLGWGYLLARLSKESILIFNGLLYAVYLYLVTQAQAVTDIFWLQGINGIATAALMSVNISYLQDAIKGRVGLSTSLMDVVAISATLLGSAAFGFLSAGADYRVVIAGAATIAAGGALVMLAGNVGQLRKARIA